MTRYFCDRCDTEMEGQSDLTVFTGEVGDGSTSSAWRTRRELCTKCVEEAKELVVKFFAKAVPKPRRT